MSENRRQLRVERELHQVIAEHLHSGLKIPLPGLASVVSADVAADLRTAKVFIKFVGDEKMHHEAVEILDRQRSDVQRHVAHVLKMKFCPVLKFIMSRAQEGPLDEVDRMLAQLHRPRV